MRTALQRVGTGGGVLALIPLVGVVLVFTVDLPSVTTVRAWVASTGVLGLVVLTFGFGLALLAPVPRSALSVAAGLVAGFGPGLAVAVGAGVLGGLGAFALSRRLGRGAAVRLAGPRLDRLDGFVGERGFVSVLSGRLIPVVPFTLLSYAAGLTGVRWVPYLAATAIGVVPGSVLQVGIGASAGFVVHRSTLFTAAPVAVGAVLLGVLALLSWRRRKRGAAAGELGVPVEPAAR